MKYVKDNLRCFCPPGSAPNLFPISANGAVIHLLGQARHLGVLLDTILSLKPHIQSVIRSYGPFCLNILTASTSCHLLGCLIRTKLPPSFTRTIAVIYEQLSSISFVPSLLSSLPFPLSPNLGEVFSEC